MKPRLKLTSFTLDLRMRSQTTNATIAQMAGLFLAIVLRDRTLFIKPKFCLASYVYYACMFRPGRRRRQKPRLRGSLPKSRTRQNFCLIFLPSILLSILITKFSVRMRKLFIFLPFPAFHCWTTVGG